MASEAGSTIKIIEIRGEKWVSLAAYEAERLHYWREEERSRQLITELERSLERQDRRKIRRELAGLAMQAYIIRGFEGPAILAREKADELIEALEKGKAE